ncbi:hypothetical protein GRI62_04045 [Erythrobacter arachoides]|uniref:Uncharacterized protein n=1 Tax=Aurantiacibacter arachoides TaxID=1850444 RepID=A0A844ZZU5_9SPHN|nr:hypothetical protein [Aurantiacibacter arachoides]MXO92780.1 hypothetical protein [Aurantiacibacter arachoides]GGD54541.1 hypothetical protein GCM10011411_13100 [Aurantiacibacter arachoides]
MIARAAFLLCALVVATVPVQAQDDTTGRVPFLPHVFFELQDGRVYSDGRLRSPEAVRNCSTETMNCIASEPFTVTWPTNCQFSGVGDQWQVGEIETSVVSEMTERRHLYDAVLQIGRTTGRNNELYFFEQRRGLVRIVYDPRQRGILANLATDADFLDELSRGPNITQDGFLVAKRVGSELLGACNTEPTPR